MANKTETDVEKLQNDSDVTTTTSLKARKLPSWMTSSSSKKSGKEVKARCLPKSITEPKPDFQLPQLLFPGRIYYCFNRDDCNFICEDLSLHGCSFYGFDIEWRIDVSQGGTGKKTSLLQLCGSSEVCYLFHLSCMNGFPTALKALLENEKILKAGVGIHGDMDRLARDYDIFAKGLVNLSDLANLKTNSNEKWSLTGLVMHLFQRQLDKDHKIRCSNWEKMPLSNQQMQYAATDAYAGYIAYKELESMEGKRNL